MREPIRLGVGDSLGGGPMLNVLRVLLRGLGAAAVAVVMATLVAFIMLFAGGGLVSLVVGQYGMAAAYGYAQIVFWATLVLTYQSVRRKETLSEVEGGAWLLLRVCVGTVVGVILITLAAAVAVVESPGGDQGLGPLATVMICSIVVPLLLS